jgi:hypothetical protein
VFLKAIKNLKPTEECGELVYERQDLVIIFCTLRSAEEDFQTRNSCKRLFTKSFWAMQKIRACNAVG